MNNTTEIIQELKTAIEGKQNVIAFGIQSCMDRQTPCSQIIREVKEMATDNYRAMRDLLGKNLLLKIQNHN